MPIVKKIFNKIITIESIAQSKQLYARWAKLKDDGNKGRYVRVSLKTTDPAIAEERAFEEYNEYKVKSGLGIDTRKLVRTVEQVGNTFATILQNDIDTGDANSTYRDYIIKIKKYIIPLAGMLPINAVSEDDINTYYKDVKRVMGKEPAKQTINVHNISWRMLFGYACKLKYMKVQDIPPNLNVKNKGEKEKPRPAFQSEEIPALFEKMNSEISKGASSTTRYKRQLMYSMCQLVYLTGIRPGTEIEGIEWDDIDMSKGLITILKGKTQEYKEARTIPVDDYVIDILRDLQKFTGSTTGNLWVMFDKSIAGGFSEMFMKFISGTGMRISTKGKYKGRNRSMYSLRHTFITERLSEGENVEYVKEYTGTSAEMIERYYNDINIENKGREMIEKMKVAPMLATISTNKLFNQFEVSNTKIDYSKPPIGKRKK